MSIGLLTDYIAFAKLDTIETGNNNGDLFTKGLELEKMLFSMKRLGIG